MGYGLYNRFDRPVSAGPRPGKAQIKGPGFQVAEGGRRGLERDQSRLSLARRGKEKGREVAVSEEQLRGKGRRGESDGVLNQGGLAME